MFPRDRFRGASLLAVLGLLLVFFGVNQSQDKTSSEVPKVADGRLVVELFAEAPQIVHPIGLDFDSKGRLLVIESHTHFPPKEYKGLKHDRVLMMEDTDNDGKADRFTPFFEGTRHTMDIAVHEDSSVYLATRNEILRLRDTDGDAKADEKKRLVMLDSKGDYPHNGLSGLCFDWRGNLFFGMGENLGVSFKLVGADGTTITGEGDGGHIFWCTREGHKLRKLATGFWNPFGITRDIYGNMFTVDNDPDAMPPCRLLHVVEGGDYGFQFRYGRQGRHPFQSWNGELPGTLPMVSGTGEAPCEVISYESDGLPGEYLGSLLVTSWADHRVERYVPKEKGASFTAQRQPFVQGGKDFRPTGMAVAPDGSLFVADWILRDYTLHGRGAIWHIRPQAKEVKPLLPPEDPKQGLFSLHRPRRERAARQLASNGPGRMFLQSHLKNPNPRIRATVLTALLDQGNDKVDLAHPALKSAGVQKMDYRGLVNLLKETDPFLRHAAVQELARAEHWQKLDGEGKQNDSRIRLGLLLAHRVTDRPESRKLIPTFLQDANEEVRFLAVKWIADQKLVEYRSQVERALQEPGLNVQLYWALATALARLDGKEVNENRLAEFFFQRLADDKSPAGLRVLALQLVPTKSGRLNVTFLGQLLEEKDAVLQREAVRALGEIADPKRVDLLVKLVMDERRAETVRAQAVVGLADRARDFVPDLLALAFKEKGSLRDETLRALVQVPLKAQDRQRLEQLAQKSPETTDLVARLLEEPFLQGRMPTKEVDAWVKLLEGPADVDAGRRIFAHPRLGGCFRCHRVEGRGNEIGPDLSTIGRVDRRSILESLLQPSNNVAPHYQAWLIETADGKIRTGMLMGTHLDEYTYLDDKGGQFKVNSRDVVSSQPAATSLMPDGLVNQLTTQEVRDLLAYLCSRK